MSDKYILDGRTPKPASLMEWATWFESADRKVAKDTVGDINISTVFLGIDHQFGEGPPLLFETMVFGGQHDEETWRCPTWEEAEAQHAKAVCLVKKSMQ